MRYRYIEQCSFEFSSKLSWKLFIISFETDRNYAADRNLDGSINTFVSSLETNQIFCRSQFKSIEDILEVDRWITSSLTRKFLYSNECVRIPIMIRIYELYQWLLIHPQEINLLFSCFLFLIWMCHRMLCMEYHESFEYIIIFN